MTQRRLNRFVEIRAVRQIRAAVDAAQALGYPALIVGNPGLGKTTALLHIMEEVNGGSIAKSRSRPRR